MARQAIAVALVALLACALPGCGGSVVPQQTTVAAPNILFVIMDDVGIDQMRLFGYGGETPPRTPNIDQLAGAGIRFHNAWAMPACTTSRAVIFEGRFPLRTNVLGALGPNDLANSMVSPYEMTTPKLLAQRGYDSALFGKFHLGLQGHNPAGYGMPHDLGWNYFAGWLDETGDPSSIDTTAGGVAPPGTWSCGFVRGGAAGGADFGACYMADGTCSSLASSGPIPPGRTCRDRGGIFDPGTSCTVPRPDYLNFATLSGHYVSPLVLNFEDGSVEQVPASDPRARRFRATADVDAAVGWIKARPAGRPWMATVSFASAHTPVMQPPPSELPSGNADSSGLDCADAADQRVVTNLMIESLDAEVGRLLVETGLARHARDGRLIYRPGQTDTMVILVGDNGTLGTVVKAPFDVSRAKGTAYQTGVWVPLIVAGPLVKQPDRVVSHMVNVADLYALFGEIAGIDNVQQAVPRPIDAVAMLPYVVNPQQASIRHWNFTQIGNNLQANGAINGPCVISGGCTQIPVSKSVCEDNNGVWWGPGADDPLTAGIPSTGYQFCCQVNAFRAAQDESLYNITPLSAVGIRNDRYKIVENTSPIYESAEAPCVETTDVEFYEINEASPLPRIDREGTELSLGSLTPEQQRNYNELSAQLNALIASAPECPGDGNIDLVVNQQDLDDWRFYSQSNGLSSVYDLNLDGVTDTADQSIIEQHLGLDCQAS
ncbi:MAG: sulfatase-like hydrolase/transferase [Deltaproteobacteria bacterium]|nr:sulfatase-like hydrolase/transferase [Deltaproteobacteria bacterium]MBI3391277.1 sulfatase-like hydrolase/transferase [Deltaproteobacteria bacterium]